MTDLSRRAVGPLRALAAGLVCLLCAGAGPATAATPADEFLPPEQAFEYVVAVTPGAFVVSYNIRDGYYLYRKRIGFATDTPGVTLGSAEFPKGQPHTDDYFGEQEIYRGGATFRVPYTVAGASPAAIDLKLKLQGCADAGLCYPPQTWATRVPLPADPAAADAGTTAAPGGALLGKLKSRESGPNDDFLPVDQAFRFSAEAADANSLRLRWVIADGYYLYKSRIKVSGDSVLAQLGAAQLPSGLPHRDDYFGEQEIYRQQFEAIVPFARSSPAAGTVALKVVYQGCADAGLCYPPRTRNLTIGLAASAASGAGGAGKAPLSEQDRLATLIAGGNLLVVVASFFGFGLLLAFTPCVLPMIPILSGIIAGDGGRVTPWRGFALSLAYVLGMAITYTIAGAAFAAAGKQAQAFFQQSWIIVLFAAMFVALAAAMFGFYELQMPSALQTRFASASNHVRGGRLLSTAVIGALSSLVVTACVAPPLVAALAVIGQAGSIARGALALFALSFGMGTPLLVVGASAGKLLPKSGPWMETVKAIFGVVFLGVAAWMLDRILPARLTMLAWALVAFAGVWVLLGVGLRGGRRTLPRWAAGTAVALYGVVLLVAAAAGGTDPLRPLEGTGLLGASARVESLPFRKVHGIAGFERELAAAKAAGQRTMLDFSADWCVSCKEMETHTFSDPAVRAALAGYRLLQADVTANDADDQALLTRFGIFGPPTTAFFSADGHERSDYRLVGYVAAQPFIGHLTRFESTP
jgi:thiol:disulfide interchange protein DsbD